MEGFLATARELSRLSSVLPQARIDWEHPNFDDHKWAIARSALLGYRVAEFVWSPQLEKVFATAGFKVATREGNEKERLAKALIVTW